MSVCVCVLFFTCTLLVKSSFGHVLEFLQPTQNNNKMLIFSSFRQTQIADPTFQFNSGTVFVFVITMTLCTVSTFIDLTVNI